MSNAEEMWETAQSHRDSVLSKSVFDEARLLKFIDVRLQQLAYEIPQLQSTRYPVNLAFFLCNKNKPCTHCPHPQWLRWIPNPKKWGSVIPSRVENPGRVMRDSPEAVKRFREARKLIEIRQDILTMQTNLTRKVNAQLAERLKHE